MRSIHFIGVGGVGMNGLAQLAVLSGYGVSGSDRAYHPTSRPFDVLEKLGIRITPQDGSGISEQTSRVVYSTAIEPDNPDLIAAKEHQIPLLHRAECLKELIGTDDLVVADVMLAPLADNGGPTLTHMLETGSPAIDTGDDAMCPELDQNGNIRPWDGDGDSQAACDRGAVELGAPFFADGFETGDTGGWFSTSP